MNKNNKIIELSDLGYSTREIANILGLHHATVHYRRKKIGRKGNIKAGRKVGTKWSEDEKIARKGQGKKHGMYGTYFYRSFYNVQQRCNNHNAKHYNSYGGRGIKVERKTFEEYYKDMYYLYLKKVKTIGEDNITIERIDNDGNYCKKNCTYIRKQDQQRNQQRHKSELYNKYKEYCLENGFVKYAWFWRRYTGKVGSK